MKFYELSHLPFKERFRIINNIKSIDADIYSDVRIVSEIFENTINWFRGPPITKVNDPNIRQKIESDNEELPSIFGTIYEIIEKSIIKDLPDYERQRIFDESKDFWRLQYPDFKLISDVINEFQTNEMLVEFRKSSPPESILNDALRVYKKCISYKEKFSAKIQKNLHFSHDTPVISYARARYCIDKDKVYSFLNQYQKWHGDLFPLWKIVRNEVCFFNKPSYDFFNWNFYLSNHASLKSKASNIQSLHDRVVDLLFKGKDLLNKLDAEISLEYNIASFEMSLYEREVEIAQIYDECDLPDEAYCYVYTLECDLFEFYVGIAANPQERFEQHIRGAYGDEWHLFKSKIIRKFPHEVRQKIIYEGTRRQCKFFEKDYIARHDPLGNMTLGGEG
jgi:hypothetical protein